MDWLAMDDVPWLVTDFTLETAAELLDDRLELATDAGPADSQSLRVTLRLRPGASAKLMKPPSC